MLYPPSQKTAAASQGMNALLRQGYGRASRFLLRPSPTVVPLSGTKVGGFRSAERGEAFAPSSGRGDTAGVLRLAQDGEQGRNH